jgi:hypothetical protein
VHLRRVIAVVRNVGDNDNDEGGEEGGEGEEGKKEGKKEGTKETKGTKETQGTQGTQGIQGTHVAKGTLESSREMDMEATSAFGRYTWRLPYSVGETQIELEIVRFKMVYEFKLKTKDQQHNHHNHHLPPLTCMDQTLTGVWEDDNNAVGWAWRYLMGTDGNQKWLEGATSALQGGAYFNRIHAKMASQSSGGKDDPGMLQVRVVGVNAWSGGKATLNRTMAGHYLIKEGGVRWVIPPSPNFNGRASVSISFNGGRQWTSLQGMQGMQGMHPMDYARIDRGPSHFVFDNRYALDGGADVKFRLSPDALLSANLTYPFNLIGRELFDTRVIFDISESVGIERNRLVVMESHFDTGVTTVHCVKSRFVGDPTCFDVKNAFRAQIESYGSIAYDGVRFRP